MKLKTALAFAAAIAATLSGAEQARSEIERTQINCNRLGYACARVTVDLESPAQGRSAGSGRITSEPAGIDCSVTLGSKSGICTLTFEWPASTNPPPKLRVSLTATPAPGSQSCLSISCSSVGVILGFEASNGDEYVERARLELVQHALTVTRTGEGTGVVASSAAGINCGSACSASFDGGSSVSLTATPDAGAEFRAWTGACAGQGATCSLTITEPITTNAVFGLKAQPQPQPQPQPSPNPSPQPQPQPAPDATVDVNVIGHKLGRSALGFRLIRIELELDERVAVTVTLARGKKTLLSKSVPALATGRRIVTLVLPGRIAKGPAYLTLRLRDTDGNTRSWSRSVLIGRSAK